MRLRDRDRDPSAAAVVGGVDVATDHQVSIKAPKIARSADRWHTEIQFLDRINWIGTRISLLLSLREEQIDLRAVASVYDPKY